MSQLSAKKFSRPYLLGLAGLGLALWAVYQHTLCPAYPPNDSPETITAAYILGIQHPPGYPLHTLLGRLALLLWPLASPAWRVNCLSAFFALASCLASASLLRRLLLDLKVEGFAASAAGLVAGLWLGLSRCFWQQALEAKGGIYLLNFLLLVLAFQAAYSLAEASHPKAAKRAFAWWIFWLGLSLANHYPSALATLPAYLPFFWLAWRRGHLHPGWASVILFAAGLSIYLYLPLRALYHPATNLAAPTDWDSFWYLVLRSGYGQNVWKEVPGVVEQQIARWWSFFFQEGTWVWPCLALGGFATLGFRARKLALEPSTQATSDKIKAFLLSLVLLYGAIFTAVVLINRTDPSTLWLMELFLLPGQLALALLAGACLALLPMATTPKRLSFIFLALLLPLVLVLSHHAYENRRQDFYTYDFAKNVLLDIPQNALYLPEGDFYYMPIYYPKCVEGRRPDLTYLHKNLLATLPGLQDLKRQKPSLQIFLQPNLSILQSVINSNPGLPLAFGTFHPSLQQDLPAAQFWQRGLIQVLAYPGAVQPSGLEAQAFTLRFGAQAVNQADPFIKNLLRWYKDSLSNIIQAQAARFSSEKNTAARQSLANQINTTQKILYNLQRKTE